jgi:hypothetical protein
MLWTICVILIVLWLLGLVTSYTMGGLIHILLVIAIIVVLVRIIQGRRPLQASPDSPSSAGLLRQVRPGCGGRGRLSTWKVISTF